MIIKELSTIPKTKYLIKLVKNSPLLWDPQNKHFKDTYKKVGEWKRIALCFLPLKHSFAETQIRDLGEY